MQTVQQEAFEFPQWGGARLGAGRKPASARRNVEHSKRPRLAARHPLHVTLRVESGLPSLRQMRAHRAVRIALAAGACRLGLRLVHFAVLSNHLHLICEADGERALSRGVQGLCVRIARAVNRVWRRAGSVFADRYHSHVLKSPREVRNTLVYVLHNARHHGVHSTLPDPCSSGAWFDGWDERITAHGAQITTRRPPDGSSPLPRARTWLLSIGWRRHGLIDPRP